MATTPEKTFITPENIQITIDNSIYILKKASLPSLLSENLLPTPIADEVESLFNAEQKDRKTTDMIRTINAIVKFFLIEPTSIIGIPTKHIAKIFNVLMNELYDDETVKILKN